MDWFLARDLELQWQRTAIGIGNPALGGNLFSYTFT